MPDLKANSDKRIKEVVLLNNDTITFIKDGRYEKVPPFITGKLKDGTDIYIPVDEMAEFVNVPESDAAGSILLILGAGFVIFAAICFIVMLSSDSFF